ncbi:amidase [Staphylococcus gallinarum]|uniref:Amidase n=1 Tax=Staphylococcus gallinarum TaxID=1293 RepID=A0A380FIQ3_STAGA|nr:amidase [Staphylococcus gallinarum]
MAKLTCGEAGQQIENYIVERIEAYNNKKQQIFFMMDLHYEDNHYHPESKLFPPHNILGTIGRELYGKVNDIYQNILFNEHVHFLDKNTLRFIFRNTIRHYVERTRRYTT